MFGFVFNCVWEIGTVPILLIIKGGNIGGLILQTICFCRCESIYFLANEMKPYLFVAKNIRNTIWITNSVHVCFKSVFTLWKDDSFAMPNFLFGCTGLFHWWVWQFFSERFSFEELLTNSVIFQTNKHKVSCWFVFATLDNRSFFVYCFLRLSKCSFHLWSRMDCSIYGSINFSCSVKSFILPFVFCFFVCLFCLRKFAKERN